MEKTAEYIERYWIWIFLGLILTRIEVEKMYEVRGGFCIGGEWLIVPLIIFITVFVSQMIKDFRETL